MTRSLLRVVTNALLVVCSLIVALIAIDQALRAIGYSPHLTSEWLLRSPARVLDDEVVVIRSNLLDADHYRVTPGSEIIVTLGDSFTEAPYVQRRFQYPEAMVSRLQDAGLAVDVVNMGLSDSGPDQHLRVFESRVLPQLRPSIVVWTLYVNDIGDNQRWAVYDVENDTLVPLNGDEHWIAKRGRLFKSLPFGGSVKLRSPVMRLILKAAETVWREDHEGDPTGGTLRTARKIELAIARLEQLAEQHGFETYYVLIPPQAFYVASSDRNMCDWMVRDYAALRRAIGRRPDLIDAWFGGSGLPPVDGCGSADSRSEAVADDIFFDDAVDRNALGDRHFNESGNRLLADLVAARILADRRDALLSRGCQEDEPRSAVTPGVDDGKACGRVEGLLGRHLERSDGAGRDPAAMP